MTRSLAVALILALAGAGAPAAVNAEDAPKLYRVESGDTLWLIAGKVFEDPTIWPALYLANRDQIKDPSRVYPGQELVVPEVAPVDRAAARQEAEALLQ